jgi:hypothetical protein
LMINATGTSFGVAPNCKRSASSAFNIIEFKLDAFYLVHIWQPVTILSLPVNCR